MQNSNEKTGQGSGQNQSGAGGKPGSKQFTNDRNQIAGADNVKPNPKQGGRPGQENQADKAQDTGSNPN